MKSNAAMKLEYLDQLDPKFNDASLVKEKIARAMKDGDFSLKEIANKTGYSPATISQVLSDDYKGETGKVEAALIRFFKNWIARNTIINTEAVRTIETGLDLAWKRKRIIMITGDNGRSKTAGVLAYWAKHQDYTVFVTLDSTFRVMDLLAALAVSLRIYSKPEEVRGPASWLKQEIIRALQRNPRLIIVDEADEAKPSLLAVLRTIWGDNEQRCAIGLVGTVNLEEQLRRTANKLRYMDTRVALRVRVGELKENDAAKIINQYDHDLDAAEIRKITNWVNHDSPSRAGVRGLTNLMTLAYDLMQSADKEEIDADIIEAAKSLM